MSYFELINRMIQAQPENAPPFNTLVINHNDANTLTNGQLLEFCNLGIEFIITAPVMEGNAYLSRKTVAEIPSISEFLKQSNN